jgi:type IV fimbrial biogenesis protein FimT
MKKYIPISNKGFTLIELMVAVAVVGIVLAFALPSYDILVKNNCLTTSTNSLVSGLQMARSEATKLRQNVSIIAKAGDWSTGWRVQDPLANVLNDVDLTCGATTITEVSADMTLVYQPTGFIDLPAVFNVCDDRTGEIGRQITINMVGRPNTNRNFVCP